MNRESPHPSLVRLSVILTVILCVKYVEICASAWTFPFGDFSSLFKKLCPGIFNFKLLVAEVHSIVWV